MNGQHDRRQLAAKSQLKGYDGVTEPYTGNLPEDHTSPTAYAPDIVPDGTRVGLGGSKRLQQSGFVASPAASALPVVPGSGSTARLMP